MSNWALISIATDILPIVLTIIGLLYVKKTWDLERTPKIHASGLFIISTKHKTNLLRDILIKKYQTLQLINVGRGPAGSVILSVRKDESGKILEDACPHAFSIPANYGTLNMKETLRVHGQRFVPTDPDVLEKDYMYNYFYISFKDHKGLRYYTKVKLLRVQKADGPLGANISRHKQTLMVWKVIENIDISTSA